MTPTGHTRFETFGFDTQDPWALNAFRLVFAAPRVYAPLAEAWDLRYPRTLEALERLTASGSVSYQHAVVFDTRTGEPATKPSRRVSRWRLTARGRRALNASVEDTRVLEDQFPRIDPVHLPNVLRLLTSLDLTGSHARYGMSIGHAVAISGLDERLGRWWMARFKESGYVARLPVDLADVRELIPAHWRANRAGVRQLAAVVKAYDLGHLKTEFRLGRRRFLTDIDLARVGVTGATDYDHDVVASRLAARMLSAQRWAGGVFALEPRFRLPANTTARPWQFTTTGDDGIFYQPDIEMRFRDEPDSNHVQRLVVEYERFQSRRDAWAHIERFLGYLHTKALPFEAGTLCFVVDSDAKKRSYTMLIEAFCDHLLRQPTLAPPNPATLAVATVDHVLNDAEPLNMHTWARIALPAGVGGADTETGPVLHPSDSTPYDMYFTRGTPR